MSQHNCKECKVKSAAAHHLNEEEFNILETNSALVSFKKGETIFKQEALSLNVAYLRTGMAKLHMQGPTRDKILRIVKAPTYLGIPTTFGDKINQFSATAIENTTVCFIDLGVFRNLIFSNGKFAYELIVELCRNELNDYQRYASLAQKQIPGLVAETIICFSDKLYKNNQFTLPLSRGEMGDLIGTSRESVSRVLSDLCSEKIISIDSNELSILNRDALDQISEKG
ncbi:MAG: Crp/Fnr family transcriptional regulator [Bacteroidota bacterium]